MVIAGLFNKCKLKVESSSCVISRRFKQAWLYTISVITSVLALDLLRAGRQQIKGTRCWHSPVCPRICVPILAPAPLLPLGNTPVHQCTTVCCPMCMEGNRAPCLFRRSFLFCVCVVAQQLNTGLSKNVEILHCHIKRFPPYYSLTSPYVWASLGASAEFLVWPQ